MGKTRGEANRRALILAAAERLFADYGLQKTTVAGIAKEAHVAVGSVYLEFTSKTLIMQELSRNKYSQVLRLMRRATMTQGSYRERFEQMMNARTEALLDIAQCHVHGSELLYASCEGVHTALVEFGKAQHELLSDFLISAHEDGEFHIPSPEHTARSILLAYTQFTPPHMHAFPPSHLPKLVEEMHQLILDGLISR